MHSPILLISIILLLLLRSACAIIGFDCSHPMSNYPRISTLEVGICMIEPKVENITIEDIYLVQRNDINVNYQYFKLLIIVECIAIL